MTARHTLTPPTVVQLEDGEQIAIIEGVFTPPVGTYLQTPPSSDDPSDPQWTRGDDFIVRRVCVRLGADVVVIVARRPRGEGLQLESGGRDVS